PLPRASLLRPRPRRCALPEPPLAPSFPSPLKGYIEPGFHLSRQCFSLPYRQRLDLLVDQGVEPGILFPIRLGGAPRTFLLEARFPLHTLTHQEIFPPLRPPPNKPSSPGRHILISIDREVDGLGELRSHLPTHQASLRLIVPGELQESLKLMPFWAHILI